MKTQNFRKLIELLWQTFPYLLKSAWFNFHYFPFKQAIKFPVLLLSKSSLKLKGSCVLEVDDVKFGMIKLGHNFHTNRANTGFRFCNYGKMVFRGHCQFGRSCSITIGEKGILEIGDNFVATYGALIYSYHHITINDRVRLGWNSVVMDTSFHRLKLVDGRKTKGYGSISIGNNVWIPSFCKVFANAVLPDYCILGAGSFVNKDYSNVPPYSLLAGQPLAVKKTGIYRDVDDDIITYE